MKQFLRRLRGIIGTGITWAAGWVALGTGLLALRGFGWDYILPAVFSNAIYGFITGGAFAVVLSLAERHRKLEDLSLRRVALWGAIGGLLVTGASGLVGATVYLEVVLRVTLLSAGFASGSVALARRGEPKLLEGDDDLPALEGE